MLTKSAAFIIVIDFDKYSFLSSDTIRNSSELWAVCLHTGKFARRGAIYDHITSMRDYTSGTLLFLYNNVM